MFFIEFYGRKVFGELKNGLAQGNVLAFLLFNIYTNNQSVISETERFKSADDLALTTLNKHFENVDEIMLGKLGRYGKLLREQLAETRLNVAMGEKKAN